MKLIVVEDEKIIRTGLLKHVPWQRLGVSEVEAAANGEEALAKTENSRRSRLSFRRAMQIKNI